MNKLYTNSLNIKSWSLADRPREKLIQHGKLTLSDAELLAIIIGSGTQHSNAVDLAKELLFSFSQNLEHLGKANIAQLKKTKGIGDAKAISIIAAMELGRRSSNYKTEANPVIQCSEDAFKELAPVLADLSYEEFWILLLNSGNRVIKKKKISMGGINKTIVDVRIVFQIALEEKAPNIILGHNHPSGTLKPSNADLGLTKKMIEGGKLLDIKILDHLIVSNTGYLSFSDSGLMNSD